MTTSLEIPSTKRTASCPPLPMLREASLREDWSSVDRRHVPSCGYCRRHLSQIESHLWHPKFSSICNPSRSDLSAQDRDEIDFHLRDDGCRQCRELDELWRRSADLQSLAAAAIAHGEASPESIVAWERFAATALGLQPPSDALRARLKSFVRAADEAADESGASLVARVERLLAEFAQNDEFARDSLAALAWSRIAALGDRMRGAQNGPIDPHIVEAASERIRRALAVPPHSAREFFQVAARQIRQELLALTQGPVFSSGDTLAAMADETTVETGQPARWREICERLERGALSADEQEVVELLWLHGLSTDDAGVVIGAEPRTVRRRWRSALLRLNDAFEGPADG